MKKIFTITVVVFTLFSSTLFADGGNDLINSIMKSADVSEEQAKGGAGALFEMAKGNMEKSDFDKVSDVVPDMDGLLKSVPALGGGKKSMFNSAATQLVGMPKVLAAFDKLGISREKVKLFSPAIINYVEKQGGKQLSKLLGDALSK